VNPAARAFAIFRALHPFPSFLVAALTLLLIPFADRHAAASLYAELGLGMLCFQFSIGLTNDIVDVVDDAQAKPRKPLPSGALSRRIAVYVVVGLAVAGLLITVPLPFGAWLIGAAGLSCGLAYDLRLKRTPLSWLPFSLALPLIPAWVWVAARVWDGFLWWAFPLGMLLGFALHLANQAPDTGADAALGVDSAVQRLGALRSARLATASFGLAASLGVIAVWSRSQPVALTVAAAAAAAVAFTPWATRLFGRDGHGGLLAVASAAIAVAFLSAV
jgi:4-hydroxybenzoate polyprenyltransferase